MKQCPACKSTYTDDTLSFCLNDGTALVAPSNLEATQKMSFSSQPTVENNQPIRVNLQSETPTMVSAPRNTTQIEQRKSSSPLMLLTIIGLLAAVGIAGTTIAYFAFWKKDNSITTVSSPTPTTTATPSENTNDETQTLKDELEKLKKQVNDQKNTKTNPNLPTLPTTTQPTPPQPTPTKTITTARVNSPGDGFLALRSAPNTKTGVQILQIPHGANVSVIGCQGSTTIGSKRGRWCRVNYAGQSGWAYDAFLIY